MARFVPLSFAFAATFVSSMPAMADPMAAGVSPSRMEAQRNRYVYYPAHGIYFSPASDTWHWNEDMAAPGKAGNANQLSASYRQYTSNGVAMPLDGTDALYLNHAKVATQYG